MAQNSPLLITGGSGFLGCALIESALGTGAAVAATFCSNTFSHPYAKAVYCDITNTNSVLQAVKAVKPCIIIHAAAVSSPNVCEINESRAWAVNTEGTANILAAAKESKSRVVFISTDLVFDGSSGQYRETDIPGPVSVYGRTKYEAERLCLSADCDNVVVRISLQYGIKHGRAASFTGWIVSRLQQNMQVPLFTDEYRSPCYVVDTARGVLCAAQNARTGEVLHLAGPERIDRYGFGKIVACAYGYPEYLLQPVTRAQKQEAAPRPRDVSFDITKFVDLFMFKPRSVYEGVYDMFSKDKKAH